MAENRDKHRMNLATLQQGDPYIKDIIDQATNVALYKFSQKTGTWVCIFNTINSYLKIFSQQIEFETVDCVSSKSKQTSGIC